MHKYKMMDVAPLPIVTYLQSFVGSMSRQDCDQGSFHHLMAFLLSSYYVPNTVLDVSEADPNKGAFGGVYSL